MIRFRFTEDERRYLTLLGQAYRLMAKHMPPAAVSEAMRAIGKTQEMLQLEGVRQGLATAAMAHMLYEAEVEVLGMPPAALLHAKAFQLHALMYGSSDTPLRAVEEERIEALDLPPGHRSGGWLDDAPMRFAPDTEEQWRSSERVRENALADPDEDPDVFAAVDALLDGDDPEQVLPSFETDSMEIPAPEGLDDDMQERPALLDQIRDVLQIHSSKGWKPSSWQELIIKLHIELGVDAGFLDLQLNTPMGRTVLEQAGFMVNPGISVNLSEILEGIREEQESAALAEAPQPVGDGSPSNEESGSGPGREGAEVPGDDGGGPAPLA